MARGGEVLLFRNDRGVNIRLRVLAKTDCQDAVMHHVDRVIPDSSFAMVGPFSLMEYQSSYGYFEFIPLVEASGALLSDATEIGAAVIRPFSLPV